MSLARLESIQEGPSAGFASVCAAGEKGRAPHEMLSAKTYHLAEGRARAHVSLKIDAEKRFAAELYLVIDVSGSMQLPAVLKDREGSGLSVLDIVVHSCRTVIHSLSEEDTLGIVTYSDEAKVILQATVMDEAGKALAAAALEKLRPEGQTNLWQGLETAMDLAASARRKGSLATILLLTDGVPNVEPSGGHLAALENYRARGGAEAALPCSIQTFGFGTDLDSRLLDDLAQAGGGSFVFIPDASFVGTALVNCTANVVTSCGQKLQLRCAFEETVELERCVGYDGHLDLGSIQLGQSKDVIFDLKFSPSVERLFRVEAHYHGPDGEQCLQAEALLPDAEPDAESTEQLLRLETFELCKELASDREAQQRVKGLAERLRSSGGGERLLGLLEDVEGQISEAVSREDWYRSWGAHYLRSLSRAHRAQVCNNFKDPGVQVYGGELFRDVRDMADEIFLKLPAPNAAERSHVEMLMAMGFPEEEVSHALDFAYNDVELAAQYLMEGMPAHRPRPPREVHAVRAAPIDMSAYYDASGG